jgi:AcrR family transcriptional regulator
MTPDRLEVACQMLATGGYTVSAVAEALGVSRKTIYRHLKSA